MGKCRVIFFHTWMGFAISYTSKFPRSHPHTLGRYPEPFTNSFRLRISFFVGVKGEVWGILTGALWAKSWIDGIVHNPTYNPDTQWEWPTYKTGQLKGLRHEIHQSQCVGKVYFTNSYL